MKMVKTNLAFLLIALISIGNLIGQIDTKKDIQFIEATLQKHFPKDEPGITLIVAKDNNIIYHGAAGMANLELEVPIGR